MFNTLYARARQALMDGNNVVIDATNVLREDRETALKHFADLDIHRRAIVIDSPIDECKRRNKLRDRKVPDFVIERFASQYVEPITDEGFDEIIHIK